MQLISSQASMTIVCTGVNDAMWIAQLSRRDYVNQMNDASMLLHLIAVVLKIKQDKF